MFSAFTNAKKAIDVLSEANNNAIEIFRELNSRVGKLSSATDEEAKAKKENA